MPKLPNRTLIVSGQEHADERGRQLAAFYGVGLSEFPTLSHWDLVRNTSVREEVQRYLTTG